MPLTLHLQGHGSSKALSAERKALNAINRRFSPITADKKWQRAERKALREVSSEQ